MSGSCLIFLSDYVRGEIVRLTKLHGVPNSQVVIIKDSSLLHLSLNDYLRARNLYFYMN